MKHVKSLSFALLCIALIAAWAFTPQHKKMATTFGTHKFVIASGSPNPYDPTSYTENNNFNPDIHCSGIVKVCAIITTDDYLWPDGTPKVDAPTGAGSLHDDVQDALNANQQIWTAADGNIIYLKF